MKRQPSAAAVNPVQAIWEADQRRVRTRDLRQTSVASVVVNADAAIGETQVVAAGPAQVTMAAHPR